MIKILDYGLGNIKAFINAYNRLGVSSKSIENIKDISPSDKIILPGVGHFDDAIKKLSNKFKISDLEDLVIVNKTPILGICVGMQILAKSSEEGKLEGLGWIDSSIIKLSNEDKVILPHMGWNNIDFKTNNILLNGIDKSKNRFYFLHSYVMNCNDQYVIANSTYNINFPCIVANDNIYGIQCHPEKSHDDGLKFLYNFSKL
tara:strand:+ start:37 stop:642 length:606 start_codon:yes stop_codon:yes gene_type:complete